MTSPRIEPGFIVLQGNRLEDLREVALQWLARQPLAPLEDEILLVQSNGIAEWLQMSMAAYPDADDFAGCGIAMGIHTRLPAQFQWQVYASVLAAEGSVLPANSLFDKPRLRWRLLRLLPTLAQSPGFEPLQHYLENDDDQRKRFQLAERLADLFDQYQVYRADWLNAWACGEDSCPGLTGNQPLPEGQGWQPALWRALIADAPDAQQFAHRAAIHEACLAQAAQLSEAERPADLPRRVVVFGISALPRQTLEVLSAISHLTQVVLCLVNPCRHHWGDIIEGRELVRQDLKRLQRKPGMAADLPLDDLHLHGHPLLAAMGKQGRDYLHMLDVHDAPEAYREDFRQQSLEIDLYREPDTSHLLGQLQDDILDLRPLQESRARWAPIDAAEDPSLVFHCGHSPLREVEILHDQLLDAFAQDPDLRPRDLIVMVPDIHSFAPAIQAVFGRYDEDDPRRIPFHVTDQQQRHQQPLLVALETLLDLPRLRFLSSEVLDLLQVPAIQRRFRLDPADLPTLERWIEESNIRWGLSAEQRKELGLSTGSNANTWQFGLERMLLGYAVGEPELGSADWDDIAPYPEVAGLNAACVGPLYRLIQALDHYRQTLQQARKPIEWSELLQQLLEAFFQANDAEESRLLGLLSDALDGWLQETGDAGFEDALPFSVIREHWLSRIDENRLTQRFFGGAVTFATLMPMRAIPFRHVYLLGMNHDAYPRQSIQQDFDLMADPRQYRPGDRSRREDDRYLFLEALLSARDRLYISWTGRSVRDNSEQPPSVLVDQLRDHIAAGWQLVPDQVLPEPDGKPANPGQALLQALTTEHPLQPFSTEYFLAGEGPEAGPAAIARKRLFTYAREWQSLHEEGNDTPAPCPASARLPAWTPEGSIRLRHLNRLLKGPLNALFEERLGIRFPDDPDTDDPDSEPFSMAKGLDNWQQHQALTGPISQHLARHPGADHQQLLESALRQRQHAGALPAQGFGELLATELRERAGDLLARHAEAVQAFPHAPRLAPTIRHATTAHHAGQALELTLEDQVTDIHHDGRGNYCRIVTVAGDVGEPQGAQERNKWVPHRQLREWPAHLALQIVHPDSETLIIGLDTNYSLAGLSDAEAIDQLTALMHCWLEAVRRPIPLTEKLGLAMADQARKHEDSAGAELEDRILGSLKSKPLQDAIEYQKTVARLCEDAEALRHWPGLVADMLPLYLPALTHILDTPAKEART